jgi:hypothetical protein
MPDSDHSDHGLSRKITAILVVPAVADNVDQVADNLGLSATLFANNGVSKLPLFMGQSKSYCGPLHLPPKISPIL